ncbi:MAG: rhodanese domain-containing protein [Rickettsia sp.]|nr:rhodanese domain-containing protein [Rickettsia sp.]
MLKYTIVNFYHFFKVEDKDLLLYKFLYLGKKKNIKGTIIIADEGINAALAGRKDSVDEIISFFSSIINGKDFTIHFSYSNELPFERFKVKIKPEIVSLKNGCFGGCNVNYVDHQDWDQFIARNDVMLLDVRNNYESKYGYFKNAIKPDLNSFREFPAWINQNKKLLDNRKEKIATYCTGGIRCEKFLVYLKKLGYNEVFQLKGGILGYLMNNSNFLKKSWIGKCFVFDNRILI